MQALTKYVGGHSDLLLGSVSVAGDAAYNAVGSTLKQLGMAVSPDDCSLALRGLKTLGIRLERLEKSTLDIAQWLSKHPYIKRVLHPALPSCPGHEHWRRDFSGSSSIFSIVFDERFSSDQAGAFADRLKLFKIGFSWGGVTSLVIVYPNLDRPGTDYGGRLVRLNVGLEEPADLIADLAQALDAMDSSPGGRP
jgi:cystathionine beta-lyase